MILKTQRLILRPWKEDDAQDLYKYAKDPRVGPSAGWPVHTSIEDSLNTIRNILSKEETYAVTLKDKSSAVGCVSLSIGRFSNIGIADDEAEIGYWLGVPYWGQGFIPEAVKEIMRHAFVDLGLNALWCGYFEGNTKSKRVQERCGFIYQKTQKKFWNSLNEFRIEHITSISKMEWLNMDSYK